MYLALNVFKLFNNNSTKENNSYLYALKLKAIESYELTNQTSLVIKNNGGAGNIKAVEGKYFVYLSCYKTKEDAEKVMQNLNESGYQLELEIIDIKCKNIDFKDKNKNNCYKNARNLFKNTYSSLYDISILVDTNALNMSQYKTKLNEIIESNNQIINEFNTALNGESTATVIYLKLYLSNLQDYLTDLKNVDNNISSAVKETYMNVIFLEKQMQQNN